MKSKLFFGILLVAFFIFSALPAAARESAEEIFEARVVKILETRELKREDGTKNIQQNILLRGLEGEFEGKEVTFFGISDLDVISSNVYQAGDKVLVNRVVDVEGEDRFFVADFVRTGGIYFLAFLFAVVVLIIGRKRGLRALASLVLSFLLILKFIIPQILSGSNPLAVSLLGGLAVIAVIIYLTEGFNIKSHLAVVAVMISLAITLLLSLIFTALFRLTGMAQEETMYLISIGAKIIDFKGLLLAGIIIGVLGVLDDVIISQIETVWQLKKVNPGLTFGRVFKGSYEVGNAHLGSVINTLFLTYAGASLPLLLLFSVKVEPFLSFTQVINNELMATEIVRAFVGSIGLALAVPITTFLASVWVQRYRIN